MNVALPNGVNGFPYLLVFIIALSKISEASVVCFIMPFVNQMVASFGTDAAGNATYAGWIESSLIATEAICSPIWGMMAEKWGRKPLLILGLAAFSVACIGVGLSRSMAWAIASRCISGVLGAVAVLTRTVSMEIADRAMTDRISASLTPCWAIGAAIGPLIGGSLAEPAKTWPSKFAGSVFDRYPYLLPSMVTALIPAASALACYVWLPETLGSPYAKLNGEDAESSDDEAEEDADQSEISMFSLIFSKKLLPIFVCNALLAFVSMGYNAAFMMMASTSLENGGLGLEAWQLGGMLAVSSVLGIAAAGIITPLISTRYGFYRYTRLCSLAHVCLFPLIALTGIVAKAEGHPGVGTMICMSFVLIAYEIAETAYGGLDVIVSHRAPKGTLSRVYGLTASVASLGRMTAPAASGILWSTSSKMSSVLGRNLIWILFTLIAVVWSFVAHRLNSPEERAAKIASKRGEEESLLSSSSSLYSEEEMDYGTFDRVDKMTSRENSIIFQFWGV